MNDHSFFILEFFRDGIFVLEMENAHTHNPPQKTASTHPSRCPPGRHRGMVEAIEPTEPIAPYAHANSFLQ